MRSLIVPVAATAAVLLTGTPGAHAATDLSTVAEALREDPVYVDPAASDQLSSSDAEALSDKIKDAGKPVFVAVLPADQPERNIFLNLRTETGITGLYAIRSGDRFGARADAVVLPSEITNGAAGSASAPPRRCAPCSRTSRRSARRSSRRTRSTSSSVR